MAASSSLSATTVEFTISMMPTFEADREDRVAHGDEVPRRFANDNNQRLVG
jgi:hypothetical protein